MKHFNKHIKKILFIFLITFYSCAPEKPSAPVKVSEESILMKAPSATEPFVKINFPVFESKESENLNILIKKYIIGLRTDFEKDIQDQNITDKHLFIDYKIISQDADNIAFYFLVNMETGVNKPSKFYQIFNYNSIEQKEISQEEVSRELNKEKAIQLINQKLEKDWKSQECNISKFPTQVLKNKEDYFFLLDEKDIDRHCETIIIQLNKDQI